LEKKIAVVFVLEESSLRRESRPVNQGTGCNDSACRSADISIVAPPESSQRRIVSVILAVAEFYGHHRCARDRERVVRKAPNQIAPLKAMCEIQDASTRRADLLWEHGCDENLMSLGRALLVRINHMGAC
jgi:hypothetical protein